LDKETEELVKNVKNMNIRSTDFGNKNFLDYIKK